MKQYYGMYIFLGMKPSQAVLTATELFVKKNGYKPKVLVVREDDVHKFVNRCNGLSLITGTVQAHHFYMGPIVIGRHPVMYTGKRKPVR